eukprot:1342185-Amorphochlora_amoeboformis.AAC.3
MNGAHVDTKASISIMNGENLGTADQLRRVQQQWQLERRVILDAWASQMKKKKRVQEKLTLKLENLKSFVEDERLEWVRELNEIIKQKLKLQRQVEAMTTGNYMGQPRDLEGKNAVYEAKLRKSVHENEILRQMIDQLQEENDRTRKVDSGLLENTAGNGRLKRELQAQKDTSSILQSENLVLQKRIAELEQEAKDISLVEEFRALKLERDSLRKQNRDLEAEVMHKNADIKALVVHIQKVKRRWENEKKELIALFQK